MPIKNRVTSKGFFADKLGSGYDELSIESVQVTQPAMLKTSSGSVNVSITEPFTMVKIGVTATLPAIGNHNVGQVFLIALTSSNTALLTANPNGLALLSSSNQQLINGSGQHRMLSGSNNIGKIVWCIAAKTPSNTFMWVAASASAS